MKLDQENVSGKVVETHEFRHRVNWSHVLVTVVLVYAIAKLGPAAVETARNRSEEE